MLGGTGDETRTFANMLWKSKANLRSLDLGYLSDDSMGRVSSHGAGVWRLLQVLPDLQHLQLATVSNEPLEEPPHSFAFHLQSLSLDGEGFSGPQIIRSLLRKSVTSLRYLSIVVDVDLGDHQIFDISNPLTSLRTLNLVLDTGASSSPERQRRSAEWLHIIPSTVASLTLATTSDYDYIVGPVDVASLPPALVHLDIFDALVSPSSLLAFLKGCRRGLLRSLKYCGTDGIDVSEVEEALRDIGVTGHL